jgi:hypothetical protein
MITRVTVTLDSVDVDLLDRLAKVQGLNRSEQVRQLLAEMRPMVRQMVETFESALRSRDEFMALVAEGEATGLTELLPEVERVQNSVLGAMARLEGALAVRESADPRPSNHGGQELTPPPPGTPE